MRLSIYNTHHSLSQVWRTSEEGNTGTRQKKKTTAVFGRSLTVLVLILSLRKLRGFLLYGFSEENSLCLLPLVMCLCFIAVLVILSVKRSYDHNASLFDEKLTWYQS